MTTTTPTVPATPLARSLRAISLCAVLAMIPAVFYCTTEGTWDLTRTRTQGGYAGRFFMAQAESMTRGRLNVARKDIWSECWDRGYRCYGYFGLTPSLLRMPILALPRQFRAPLTPLYVGVAVLLGYWFALRLLARSLLEFGRPETPPGAVLAYFVAGALAIGPGGTLLFLTRPAVYEEAAAWGVAFLLMTLDRVWVWARTGRTRTLVAAVICGIAAGNGRPTAVTACAGLGLVVAALSYFALVPADGRRWRTLLLAACLSVLPLATTFGVLWLKLGSPLPDLRMNEQIPEAPFWAEILRINGGKAFGLTFLPTELFAYLRPDAVAWRPIWPYADFAFPERPIVWIPPLPPGGAYLERFTSTTSTMPWAWVVNLVVVGWLAMSARRSIGLGRRPPPADGSTLSPREWVLAAGLFAGAGSMIALTVTTVGLTNRYLADFFPVSVVGLALGHRAMLPALTRRPLLGAAALAATVVLVGWSLVVTPLLTLRLLFW